MVAGRGRSIIPAILAVLIASGCFASKKSSGRSGLATKVVETIEYYPRFVKGYQGTYPPSRMIVLKPIDSREYPAKWRSDLADFNGNTPVGVVEDSQNRVVERLYSPPFIELVQKALAQAASEAGLVSSTTNQSDYAAVANLNPGAYVLASRITRCWVERKIDMSPNGIASFRTWAEFDLDVTVYKAPFHVPFWQSKSVSVFYDPPPDAIDPGLASVAALYDDPAQVLSVAFTRAVAGVFNRYDLRNLIENDQGLTQ